MKKIRHFLNIDELSKKDMDEILLKSHLLKKIMEKSVLKEKNTSYDF